MSQWLLRRLGLLKELSRQPFVRILLLLWAGSGAWDLALSEWIPEEYAKHLPRVYQVVALMTGLISWQLWTIMGFAIVAFACLEYGVRSAPSRSAISQTVTDNTLLNRYIGGWYAVVIIFLALSGTRIWYYWKFRETHIADSAESKPTLREKLEHLEQLGPLFKYFEDDTFGAVNVRSIFAVPVSPNGTAPAHDLIPALIDPDSGGIPESGMI
jgi:hypothetical protein